ncbi:MAG: SDR family NAD(P)-dependent oxidoreductase [Desulfatibacillaceae bacterium]
MLNRKKKIRGQVALITGAGSGIGRQIALALGRKGARVIITDIREERISAVLAELSAMGVVCAGYRVDHADEADVHDFARQFLNDWRRVDILCSNAGVGGGGRIEEMSLDDWRWIMGVNFWGAVYLLNELVPSMIEQKGGSILITASIAGLVGLPGMSSYCSSKFAVVGLAESLGVELARHNISVSALCPGIINTNIIDDGRIYMADETGASGQSKVAKFYATKGSDPAIVARHAVRALERDKSVMPSPLHAWPLYLLKRVSPQFYRGAVRMVWKSGLLM